MYVSYPAPQSPVTPGGPTFVSAMKDSRTTPSNAASVSWIPASMPSVINIFKGSLSAAFNDVPELIVKRCVQFITIPVVHIFRLSFPTRHFPNILKTGKIQPRVKKGDEQYIKNYRPI